MKQEELLKSGPGSLAEFQPEMPITCPECGEQYSAKLDRKSMTLRPIPTKKPDAYGKMMRIVDRYMVLKEFDGMSTWKQVHLPRHLKSAKKLLAFFRRTEDPLWMALQCLEEVAKTAKKENWEWTLETVVKRSDDWWKKKRRGDDD